MGNFRKERTEENQCECLHGVGVGGMGSDQISMCAFHFQVSCIQICRYEVDSNCSKLGTRTCKKIMSFFQRAFGVLFFAFLLKRWPLSDFASLHLNSLENQDYLASGKKKVGCGMLFILYIHLKLPHLSAKYMEEVIRKGTSHCFHAFFPPPPPEKLQYILHALFLNTTTQHM